jgi:hypothetical protein
MITEEQGFDAMRHFLKAYWHSRGEGDEIRLLLSSMNTSSCADGKPLDLALWDQWLSACEVAKAS